MKQLIFILFFILPFFSLAQKLIPYLKKNGKYIYVDSTSMNPVFTNEYDFAQEFNENVAIVFKNNLFGIINDRGKEITPLKYDGIDNFESGLAKVFISSDTTSANRYRQGKYGFIDIAGKEVIPIIYDDLSSFIGGLAECQIDRLKGFIDKMNHLIVPLIYTEIVHYKNGSYAVKNLNGKWGLIGKYGKILLPCEYDGIGQNDGFGDNFENGLVSIFKLNPLNKNIKETREYGKRGIVDENGKILIQPQNWGGYGEILILKDGFILSEGFTLAEEPFTHKLRNLGFIDKSQKTLIQINYGDYRYRDYNDGLIYAYTGKGRNVKEGVIDTKGKVIIPFKFGSIRPYQEGLASVEDGIYGGLYGFFGDKYGFINKVGKLVIPMIYNDVRDFKGGMSRVELSYDIDGGRVEKFGYINNLGNIVVPIIYEWVYDFKNGLTIAQLGGKLGIIDKYGKIITGFMFDKIDNMGTYPNNFSTSDASDYFKNGLAQVQVNSKVGYIDKAGIERIPIKYDQASYHKSGLILTWTKNDNNTLIFYIDREGREYIEK